jgi:hypothetical protein
MCWDGAEQDVVYIQRTHHAVDDLKRGSVRGISVNMPNFNEMDRVVEAFGGAEKYARLGRLKAQYDPENLFQMNDNIAPVQANRNH